jgi:hypothetical protein
MICNELCVIVALKESGFVKYVDEPFAEMTVIIEGKWRNSVVIACYSTDKALLSIWKWRNQYGEVLGGLGTGIGEGDRGVTCGRESQCVAAREREQETDCDAADAREADGFLQLLLTSNGRATSTSLSNNNTSSGSSLHSLASPSGSIGGGMNGGADQQQPPLLAEASSRRNTPSPAGILGPGYSRHEIEGIGGVVKTKLVRMVRVGACVPEWADEKATGDILSWEAKGRVRSWCGWCWRVIPGKDDYEIDREKQGLCE